MREIYLKSLLSFSLLLFGGCQNEIVINDVDEVSDFDWRLPKNINAPRVPEDNPITNEKVELGRFLFYDKKLSGNGTFSCESCHFQEFAFADKNMVGIGSTGEFHVRNPQHLSNSAYYTTYAWANPALGTLESFIIMPLTGDSPVEMGVVDDKVEEVVLKRFETNETYQKMFNEAFPEVENPFKLFYIVKALASFVRTLNSFNSPYDKFMRGDSTALTESQRRGMDLFNGEKAECFHCHSGDNFSDSTADIKSYYIEQFYHNIGLYNINDNSDYKIDNQGLFESTYNPNDRGRFRAPSLRNVEVTAPYMHDGSMATLREVMELHSRGGRLIEDGEFAGDGRLNENVDGEISPKSFTEQEMIDLENFLKSLTDREFLSDERISNPFRKVEN
jgi:cytochrome c peroxidase